MTGAPLLFLLISVSVGSAFNYSPCLRCRFNTSPSTRFNIQIRRSSAIDEYVQELVNQGIRFQETGLVPRARSVYEEALDYAEKHPEGPSAEVEAMCLWHLATALVELDEVGDGLNKYKRALLLCPRLNNLADIHMNMAAAFESISLMAPAESEYKAAMKAEPSRPEPHRYLGDILRQKGVLEQAEAEYRTAIVLAHDGEIVYGDLLPELYTSLGTLLELFTDSGREDRKEESLAVFNLAVHSSSAVEPLALYEYSRMLELNGDRSEAERYRQLAEVTQEREEAKEMHLHVHPSADPGDFGSFAAD